MVAGGTASAQALSMLFSPVVTRLYGPETYGLQGVFMSIAGVLGGVAALTYPIAIVLPKSDTDATGLAWLSIYVGGVVSLLTTIVLFFFGHKILTILKAETISDFIYLIPVFMFFTTVNMVASQWLIRKKTFKLTAKIMVLQTLIINLIKAWLGFVNPTATVLIITNTFGALLSPIMMLYSLLTTRKNSNKEVQDPQIVLSKLDLAKRHIDFPLLRAPQILLNSISQSLPIMMLATYFGPASAGFYSIACVVLSIPTGLIGNSVMQVFYPRINEAIDRKEDVKALIIKATIGLALSGLLPFTIVIIAGPTLFDFVFGTEWQLAGVYAQWLSIWLFFQYINKPAVSAIPALRLQKGLLIYELFSTSTKVLALYIGYTHYKSDVVAIALFSLFGVAAYLWLILWVIFHSGKLSIHTVHE